MSKMADWLNMEEACAILGISRNTLKKLIREGDVPAYTVAGVVGYKLKREDVEALIKPVPVQKRPKGPLYKKKARQRK